MLKLIKHPDLILNEVMPDFDFENPVMAPQDLEEHMVKLMWEKNGIGLAANQVGIRARVFTIMTRSLQGVTEPFAVFNPKVLAVSEELEQGEEGCLSFPNLFLHVKRPYHVVAEFLDRDKNTCIIRFDGIDARCFLHELDHLNGVCFTNGISKLKLDLAIKKQRKLNGRTQQRITTSV
jgi:peptide deformylase